MMPDGSQCQLVSYNPTTALVRQLTPCERAEMTAAERLDRADELAAAELRRSVTNGSFVRPVSGPLD